MNNFEIHSTPLIALSRYLAVDDLRDERGKLKRRGGARRAEPKHGQHQSHIKHHGATGSSSAPRGKVAAKAPQKQY